MKAAKINLYTDDREYAEALAISSTLLGKQYCIDVLDVGDYLEILPAGKASGSDERHCQSDGVGKTTVSKYGGAADIHSAIRRTHLLQTFASDSVGTDLGSISSKSDFASYSANVGRIEKSGCGFVFAIASHGGMGSSTFSINLARDLSRYRGKRVMFISFDTIEPGFDKKRNDESSMIDKGFSSELFLYRYLYDFAGEYETPDGKQAITDFVGEAIQADEYGVFAMSPSTHLNPIIGLDRQTLLRVVADITECKRLDYIVLDFGKNIDRAAAFSQITAMKIVMIGKRHDEKLKNLISALLNPGNEIISFIYDHADDSGCGYGELTGDYGLEVKNVCDKILCVNRNLAQTEAANADDMQICANSDMDDFR